MTKPKTVVIGQTIELIDGQYIVAGYNAGVIKLRSVRSSQHQLMDMFELSDLLAPGETLDKAEERRARVPLSEALAGLSDQTRRLIPHLQELHDGTPALGDAPRDEYAPEKAMVWKLEKKAEELSQLGIKASASKLKRDLKAYRLGGPAALMDGRKDRNEKAMSRVSKEVKELLAEILSGHSKKSTPTKTAIYARLDRRLKELYPNSDERPKMPSPASVNRYIEMMDADRGTTGSARTRKSKLRSPDRQYSGRLVSAPGDEAQIDNSPFDAFVRFPNGDVRRPWLTLMVDKRTKSILGFSFTPSNPTGSDHALLIARALVPHRKRPWAKSYQAFELPEMPWAVYLTHEKRAEYDTHRPYIVPRRIITDNGKDFLGEQFESVCARYGIHTTKAAYEDPTAKAQVERMFRTVRQKFTQYLPGYTGGSVEFRGEEPEKDQVISLEMLEELFDRWVAIVWQNRVHDSLVDAFDPRVKHTPNTMFAASMETTGHFFVPIDPMDYLRVLPSVRRAVRAQGVTFNKRWYDSVHLGPLRGQEDDHGRKVLLNVYYDPSNAERVWVHAPEKDEWITCESVDEDGKSRPLESALQAKAHKLHLDHGGFSNREADGALLSLFAEVTEEAEESERERVRALMAEAAASSEPAPLSKTYTPFDDGDELDDDAELEML